jgi:hydrogenase nickel incorporation protein HypA/HybF
MTRRTGMRAMHEVSLMQSVLEIAEEQARGQGATRIHAITLRIGRLAGVEPEALSLAFEVVTQGTPAEGASLEVETVEVVCRCPACEEEFTPPDFIFRCPAAAGLPATSDGAGKWRRERWRPARAFS